MATEPGKAAGKSWWRAVLPIVRRVRVFKKRLWLIGGLALLATVAQLIEPIIYRTAINDLAGVFVGRGGGWAEERAPVRALAAPGSPGAAAQPALTPEPRSLSVAAASGVSLTAGDVGYYHQAHSRGHVAPRRLEQAEHTLLWAIALLFLTSLAAQFFELAADNVANLMANQVERRFILRVFDHLLKLPLGFFQSRPVGALAKRVDQSDRVAPILLTLTKNLLPEALMVLGILAIMLVQSWRLALVALATLPVYLWLSRRSAAALEGRLDEYYEQWEAVSAHIHETLGAVKTVKLSGAELREAGRLGAGARDAYHSYHQRQRLANRYAFWERLVIQTGKALVFLVGGLEVIRHQLTPGDVVMFVAYLELLYDPVENLSAYGLSLQQNARGLEKSLKLMDRHEELASGSLLGEGRGGLRCEGLNFSYPGGGPVLKDLSFTVEAGSRTGLAGPSGAGKSTLVDLLLKFYEPKQGRLLLDGVDLRNLDAADLRRQVGVVAADGAVFRGTLADNIRYKRPAATGAEVLDAAEQAGLGPLLRRLPKGLETAVGDAGVGLSLGERQRLQIARVLASRPRLLILDEATANLDYVTEAQVMTALDGLRGRCTLLIIAHRYSMLEGCDQVLVLEQGRLIQQGTPGILAAQPGWFSELARHHREGQTPA